MIALDVTYSAGAHLSGVGVYCREILDGVAGLHPEQPFIAAFRSQQFLRSFRQHLPANCRRRLLSDRFPVRRATLFHGLNQRMPLHRAPRTCCTFHDLFVLTGDYSTAEFRARFAQQARDAAARSDLIICVSHFTASQVNQLLGVEPSRLRVIHHGARPAPPSRAPREPVVLSVGALQKRKNTLGLVRAFEQALPAPWRLVLAGAAGYGAAAALAAIDASPARDRIEVPGYVEDRTLVSLYARATIFAFPSFDEGFGMPVLEAMASGVAVIASNRSALPETCGDAALLVNPDDEAELTEALVTLANDPERRNELARQGLLRVADCTWERAAQQTWSVYRELL